MPFVILGAAIIGLYLYSKAQPATAAPIPPVSPVPASTPVPTVTPDSTNVQSEISALQSEVAQLTKPVDPLAPKVAPPPPKNILPNIAPPIAPDEALNEAKQGESNLNPRDFANSTWLSRVYGEIVSMHTLAWNPATGSFEWSGAYQRSASLQLVGQGSQLALSVASDVARNVGSSVASAIPFIGTAVSTIVGLFGAIQAHHAQAVQRDSNAYNQGLDACENYLEIIHNAIMSGQSTPDEGINALDSMYSDFLTFTAPARNNNPYCNSVCEAKVQLNALVIYWKAYYGAIITAGNGLGVVAAPKMTAPQTPAVTAAPKPDCGARPVRSDYDDSASYAADYRAWLACTQGRG